MEPVRILVVEDELEEPLEDNFIITLLEDEAYDITIARTGEEAYAKMAAGRFSLILLDMMLPPSESASTTRFNGIKRLDMGVHLLELLRKGEFEPKGARKDTLVVVVSAVPGLERWKKIIGLLGNEQCLLPKPAEPEVIFEVVQRTLADAGLIAMNPNDEK